MIQTRLKEERARQGLTLRQLESVSGVSNAMISQIETGRVVSPSVQVIHALANGLKVPPEWLAFGHRCNGANKSK